jgi:hypothetical protein
MDAIDEAMCLVNLAPKLCPLPALKAAPRVELRRLHSSSTLSSLRASPVRCPSNDPSITRACATDASSLRRTRFARRGTNGYLDATP